MTLSTLRLCSVGDSMVNEYGAVGGMRIDRGNRCTRTKPAPVPFCPQQIQHNITRDRTRGTAVSRLLIA
jgi:hypothetical protein